MLCRAAMLAWLCCCASLACAETRVALVIGNGSYANVGRLDNPARDAATVAGALREVGFEVQTERDLGHDALLKALRRFEEAADKADWALVYYAGHGIEVGGVNYLVPVDARLRSDRDVDEEAVSLAQVQKRLEGARTLRLVILDACRDNPFQSSMKRTLASRSVGRGLARPELPQSGSLVAYSAAAGQVASDGETGAANSPYVAALLKALATPDLEVNLFFRQVRADVLDATGRRQEPATYESLPPRRFVLNPANLRQPPAQPQKDLSKTVNADPNSGNWDRARHGFVMNVGDRVFFERNSSQLTGVAKGQIKKVVAWLAANRDFDISLEGYAAKESPQYNDMKISVDRANAVQKYMISNGLEGSRIVRSVGLGDQERVGFCNDDVCFAMNNRVVFAVRRR